MSKFVFFGTSNFAVTVLSELLPLDIRPSLVITQPDAPYGRKRVLTPPPVKVWAGVHKIPLLQPASLRKLASDSPLFEAYDLGVVADYGKIIPQKLLDVPKRGMLNIHVSLLPQYRGASPMQTAILDGVSKTGVTIMQVVEKLDEGDIVAQEEFDLSSWHPAFTELAEHSATAGAKLLAKVMEGWIERRIVAIPQDNSKATYTKLFTDADGFVEPSTITGEADIEDVRNAERRVRALNPNPGTWTKLTVRGKETRIKIKSAEIIDGRLVPIMVIPEGKKEMRWEDFRRGNLQIES